MKFVTVRDLVSNQKKTRQMMGREESVLTYNGKPIALTIPVNEDNFEYILNEANLLTLKGAVKSMQKKAKAYGMTENDIEHEIKAARKEMAKKRK